jgi:hypothetical protein
LLPEPSGDLKMHRRKGLALELTPRGKRVASATLPLGLDR